MIAPYPLLWPDGVPRTAKPGDALFSTTRAKAMDNVEASLVAFGRDSGIKVGEVHITSNVAGLRGGEPDDAGVAVWFTWDGATRAIAVDRYKKVEWNLQAIHHILEADRTKMRHGGINFLRASFRSHIAALPAPGAKPWYEVIGVAASATPAEIDEAYKARVRILAGQNDHAQLSELNVARDQARKKG